MNESRSVFSIHGVTGMLIATVLLLTILVVLTIWGLGVQNENAANFYKVEDAQSIKMFSSENVKHIVDVE